MKEPVGQSETPKPTKVRDLPQVDLSAVFSRLRSIAMEQGITNRELAEEIDVIPSNMSRWAASSEGRDPPLSVIRWLAGKLNRSVLITQNKVLIIPDRAAKVLSGYSDVE